MSRLGSIRTKLGRIGLNRQNRPIQVIPTPIPAEIQVKKKKKKKRERKVQNASFQLKL